MGYEGKIPSHFPPFFLPQEIFRFVQQPAPAKERAVKTPAVPPSIGALGFSFPQTCRRAINCLTASYRLTKVIFGT
jgi:hypothetical protein